MNYIAALGEKTYPVDIQERANGIYEGTIGGEHCRFQVVAVHEGGWLLLDEQGVSHHVVVERLADQTFRVVHRGVTQEIGLYQAREWHAKQATQARTYDDGPLTIRCPMPGKIVSSLVAIGETVRAGQGLIVIEAMKMQNELKAPRQGVVTGVHVTTGQSVDAGVILCTIE